MKKGRQPKYMEIATQLDRKISAGELKPGDYLPPMRDLASQFNCAICTIQGAMKVLQSKCRVDIRRGQGIVVRGDSRIKQDTILAIFPKWNILGEESFAARFVLGVNLTGSSLGYSLETFSYDNPVPGERERLSRHLEKNTYSGVIWANPVIPGLLGRLEGTGAKVVFTHRHYAALESPYTYDDFQQAAEPFARALLDRGVRSLGIIGTHPRDETYAPGMEILIDGFRQSGIVVRAEDICRADVPPDSKEFKWLAEAYLDESQSVDAYFSRTPNIMNFLYEIFPDQMKDKITSCHSIHTVQQSNIDIILSSNVRTHAVEAANALHGWIQSGQKPENTSIPMTIDSNR